LAATTHRTRPGAVAPPSIPARKLSSEHSKSTATAATVEAVEARAATDLVRCWSTANARHLAVSPTTSKGVESAPLSTLPVAVDAPATCAPPPRPGSEAPPDAMAAAKLLDWCGGRPDRRRSMARSSRTAPDVVLESDWADECTSACWRCQVAWVGLDSLQMAVRPNAVVLPSSSHRVVTGETWYV